MVETGEARRVKRTVETGVMRARGVGLRVPGAGEMGGRWLAREDEASRARGAGLVLVVLVP